MGSRFPSKGVRREGKGDPPSNEDYYRYRLHAARGAAVHGAAGRRAHAKGRHGGDREAHDDRTRPLLPGIPVQGLAADRRHERRVASGISKTRRLLSPPGLDVSARRRPFRQRGSVGSSLIASSRKPAATLASAGRMNSMWGKARK